MSDIYDPFGEFDDLENPSYTYLMEELRHQSKILVMNEIYRNLMYRHVSIDFNNKQELQIIVERLISWFEEAEEYEKCNELKKILE